MFLFATRAVRHTIITGAVLAATTVVLVASRAQAQAGQRGATAGVPAKLGFVAQPTSGVTGAAMEPAVRVAVQDARGRTVTSSTAEITLTITPGVGTPGAILGGTVTRQAVAGIATFPDLTFDQVGAGYTLTAASADLAAATSEGFGVSGRASMVDVGWSSGCALTTTGVPYCWGDNSEGQLGNGLLEFSATPVKVRTDLTFVQVTVGRNHACGLTADGQAHCWGSSRSAGLSDSAGQAILRVPLAVRGGERFQTLSAGDGFTCGVTRDRSIVCWGYYPAYNYRSQASEALTKLETTSNYACALSETGKLSCWGMRGAGGFSPGDFEIPAAIEGTGPWMDHRLGYAHACGVRQQDSTWACWREGGLYTKDERSAGAAKFTAVAAGRSYACGLSESGEAWCWQNYLPSVYLTPVSGPWRYTKISADNEQACGITASGELLCWLIANPTGFVREVKTQQPYRMRLGGAAPPAAPTAALGPLLTAADSADARAAAASRETMVWEAQSYYDWLVAPDDSLVFLVPRLSNDGAGSPIRALDILTGQRRWSTAASRPVSKLTLRPGTAFFVEQESQRDQRRQWLVRQRNHLVALDTRTGTERWRLKDLGRGSTPTLGLLLEMRQAPDNPEVKNLGVTIPPRVVTIDGFMDLPGRDSAHAERVVRARRALEAATRAATGAATSIKALEAAVDSLCPERDGKNRCKVPKGTTREAHEAVLASTTAALDSTKAAQAQFETASDSLRRWVGDASADRVKNGPLADGDAILRIDGQGVDSIPDVAQLVARHRPGDTIEVEVLTYYRGWKTQRYRIPLLGEPAASGWTEMSIVDSTLYFGRDSTLVGVDAVSGAVRLEVAADAMVMAPAADAATVYFGDRRGVVHAVDRQTGRVRWTTSLVPEGDRRLSERFALRLAVTDSTLVAASTTAGLYALDLRTGAVRWEHPAGGSGSPTLADGMAYVFPGRGGVLAVRLQDGTQAWQFTGQAWPAECFRTYAPAVAHGELVFADRGRLVALNGVSGQVKWEKLGVGVSDCRDPGHVGLAHGFALFKNNDYTLSAYGRATLTAVGKRETLARAEAAKEAEKARTEAGRRPGIPDEVKTRCALQVDEDAMGFFDGRRVDTDQWRQTINQAQNMAYTRCLNQWNFRNR